MSLYRLLRDPPPALQAPVLIVALDGWVDAAGVATGAAAHIGREGEPLATFDVDELIDYRTRRPVLDIVEGTLKEMAWPELGVRLVRAGARDLLVMSGPEPDYRWRALSEAVLELAVRLGVVESVTVGAIPAAVPHTRPTPVLATASRRERLGPEDRTPEGLLRVPAAAVSAIEMRLQEAGIPVTGFFAQAPHYVTPIYAAGVMVLVERIGRHLGVMFPTESLARDAQDQRAQLDAIVAEREDLREYIARLESVTPEGALPTGDELAAEIEKYLRQDRGDEGRQGR